MHHVTQYNISRSTPDWVAAELHLLPLCRRHRFQRRCHLRVRTKQKRVRSTLLKRLPAGAGGVGNSRQGPASLRRRRHRRRLCALSHAAGAAEDAAAPSAAGPRWLANLRFVAQPQAQQGGAERRQLRRLGKQVCLHGPPLLLQGGEAAQDGQGRAGEVRWCREAAAGWARGA